MMVLFRQLVVVYLVLISVVSVKGECLGLGLGLWCLVPLSKIFSYIVAVYKVSEIFNLSKYCNGNYSETCVNRTPMGLYSLFGLEKVNLTGNKSDHEDKKDLDWIVIRKRSVSVAQLDEDIKKKYCIYRISGFFAGTKFRDFLPNWWMLFSGTLFSRSWVLTKIKF